MAIKEITIGFARTVNLGNYESARVEASVKAEVDEDWKFDTQIDCLQIELKGLLEKTWNAQRTTIKGTR